VDIEFLLAGLFFFAAFIFWVMCWMWRKRPESLTAFWFACVFEFGGFLTLTVWRITNS
jgi:hypothetical protein